MDLEQAVLKLRPKFADRLKLRKKLRKLTKQLSYFATIPMDITNIILELLPDLRHKHSPEVISAITDQFDKFAANYLKFTSDNNLLIIRGFICLKTAKFKQDHPDMYIGHDELILKNIKGKLTKYPYGYINFSFIGNDRFWSDISGNLVDLQKNPAGFMRTKFPNHIATHFLPCGLIRTSSSDAHKLLDPETGEFVVINNNSCDELIDDCGNCYQLGRFAIAFSHLGTLFLRCSL